MEVEELMILLDGVEWKLDGVVDSVPPEKSCKVLDEEFTNKQWGENDSENLTGSDDFHILLK